MKDQAPYKIRVDHLSFYYGDFQAINDLSLEIRPREVFGLMGPAKSGKSTFLRVLNRMCDLITSARVEGSAHLDDEDILAPDYDLVRLRRRVGLVLSKPVPLPRSIMENLILAPKLAGKRDRQKLAALAEASLKAARLWDEVKDRLQDSALKLSGGQQQRLCLARTLAMEPEV
ncbi:MAG: ATP-binding cassette domain-containing protein, partial [Deltaproteobacteria bacterium]|nr:ATP-binding cassette domain-containing protein [Deltaproteobacteria bacterium]